MLTRLTEGQEAIALQLPAEPRKWTQLKNRNVCQSRPRLKLRQVESGRPRNGGPFSVSDWRGAAGEDAVRRRHPIDLFTDHRQWHDGTPSEILLREGRDER